METTQKSPSPSEKPAASVNEDWKTWHAQYFGVGKCNTPIGVGHSQSTFCGCCGAAWLNKECKVAGYLCRDIFRGAGYDEREGYYLGEQMDHEKLATFLEMKEYDYVHLEEDGCCHAIVWKKT